MPILEFLGLAGAAGDDTSPEGPGNILIEPPIHDSPWSTSCSRAMNSPHHSIPMLYSIPVVGLNVAWFQLRLPKKLGQITVG